MNDRKLPDVFLTGTGGFPKAPALCYIATYTMNLVTIASLVINDGFVFNEENYGKKDRQNAETRPWDRLTALWRSWFTVENLAGLATILKSVRDGDRLTINCHSQFEANNTKNKVETTLSVAAALLDELSVSLAGLQTSHFCNIMKMNEDGVLKYLKQVDMNFYFEFIVQIIRREINCIDYEKFDCGKINKFIVLLLDYDNLLSFDNNTLVAVFEIIEFALIRKTVYLETQKKLLSLVNQIVESGHFRDYDSIIIKSIKQIRTIFSTMLVNPLILWKDERYNRRYRDIDMFWDDNLIHFMGLTRQPIESLWYEERIIPSPDRISPHTFNELIETDPNSISRLLYLYMLSGKDFPSDMVEHYYQRFADLVRSVGIEYISTITLVNTISIAQISENRMLLEFINNSISRHINDMLHDRLGNRYFTWLILEEPKFLNKILDLNPMVINPDEFFHIASREPFEYFFRKIDRRWIKDNFSLHLFFDYLELCRKLPSSFLGYFDKLIDHLLSNFKNNNYSDVFFQTITLTQYENLKWYSKNAKSRQASYLLHYYDDKMHRKEN